MKSNRRRRQGNKSSAEMTRRLLFAAEQLESRSLLSATPWTNPKLAVDVNDDGYVTPLDALNSINDLNRYGSRSLFALDNGSGEGEGAAAMYLDTNGDGHSTPADTLKVVNFLNAEGEGTATMNYIVQAFANMMITGITEDLDADDLPDRRFSFRDNGATGDTIVRAGSAADRGSWLSEGFQVGDRIFIADSGKFVTQTIGGKEVKVHQHNNGFFTIKSVTDTTITVADGESLTQLLSLTAPKFFKPISSIGTNQDFILGTISEDLRTMTRPTNQNEQPRVLENYEKGVFGAYLDVVFDSTRAGFDVGGTTSAEVGYYNSYAFSKSANLADPSVADEVGAALNSEGFAALGAGKHLVWTISMSTKNVTGEILFAPDAADTLPANLTLMNGDDSPVCGGSRTSDCFGTQGFVEFRLNVASEVDAQNDTLTVQEGAAATPVDIFQNDTVATGTRTLTHVNGTVVQLHSTVNTANGGTVTVRAADVTYRPAAGFNGADPFTYTISNGLGATDTATVAVTVTEVNDPPTVTVPGAQSVNEDTNLAIGGVSVADVDSANLTVSVTSTNGKVTVANSAATITNNDSANVTIAGSVANVNTSLAGLSFLGNQDFSGSAVVTVSATDGIADASRPVNRSVTVTVNAVNDPPVNTVPGDQTTFMGANLVFNAANGNVISVADVDSNSLNVALSVTQGTLTLGSTNGVNPTGNGSSSVSLSGTPAAISAALLGTTFGVPSAGFIGEITVTMNSSDGPDVDLNTFKINVVPPTRPFAANDSFTDDRALTEDGPAATLTVLANDLAPESSANAITQINGANVAVGGTVNLPEGVLTNNGTSIGFDSADNYFGTVAFTYTIASTPDAGDGPDTGNVTVEVKPQNDAPTVAAPNSASGTEDTPLAIGGISVADIDADVNGGVAVTLTVANGKLTANGPATVQGSGGKTVTISGTTANVNATIGSLQYAPDDHFNGSDTLAINVTDNGNTGPTVGTASANITVNIAAVNDAPTVAAPGPQSSFITNVDNAFSSAISVADVDAGNGNIQVTLAVAMGSLSVTPNGATVTGNNSGNMTLTGPLNAVNAALNSLMYRSAAAGDTSLNMGVSDQGNTGGPAQTANATVNITVLDYVPVDIGGEVFVDADRDHTRDQTERGVAGVRIILSGTDFLGNPVTVETTTDQNGEYIFEDVRPGTYTVREVRPSALISDGNQDGTSSLDIGILGDVQRTGESLAITGLAPEVNDGWDLFALSQSTGRDEGIVITRTATGDMTIFGAGWDTDQFSNPRLVVGGDGVSATFTVFDRGANADRSVNVSLAAGNLRIAGSGADRTYRILGGSVILAPAAGGEGESVAPVVPVVNSRAADSLFARL